MSPSLTGNPRYRLCSAIMTASVVICGLLASVPTSVAASQPQNIGLGKHVTVTTNGADDPAIGAGISPADITDGSLVYEPASTQLPDGVVGYVNNDYNELLEVTVTIDLGGEYDITRIRYNMGNVQFGDTWGADELVTPFGATTVNPGSAFSGAWTEQIGEARLSTVEVILRKTRTNFFTDWLFIGEIEVYGTPANSGSMIGHVALDTGGSLRDVTISALSGAGSFSATTNQEGIFTFDGLPAGDYTVTPSKVGYSFTPASQGVTVPSFEALTVEFTASATGATPYAYTSFDGLELQLYPYEGEQIALLVADPDLDETVLTRIVTAIDGAYAYYQQATGREPAPHYQYNGRATVAVAPSTCSGRGAGCGFLGWTGIELTHESFAILYNGVRDNDEYDQVVFYELGRNFWFYGDSIEYKGDDATGAITTGYAVFMRFLSMEAAAVAGGPFRGESFAHFQAEVEGMLARYVADATLDWFNTLAIDRAPANPMGLGASDLFAAHLFELRRRYGGDFIPTLWQQVANRPTAQSTQDAVDNFVIAASLAAGENLAELFATEWRWPLSADARQTLAEGLASLAIDHSVGAPGSYFTIQATGFPPHADATVGVDRNSVATLTTDAAGALRFVLGTAGLAPGTYTVSVQVNPVVVISFVLDTAAPVHPHTEDAPLIDLAPILGLGQFLYLPVIVYMESSAETPVPEIGDRREWTFHMTADGVHPNGLEQQMMWLMNRARANPTEEGIWLATTDDPDIANPRAYFNVNTAVLAAEFASYPARPPAAFDNRLYAAAHAHSTDLIMRDTQDHQGQFERIVEAGFFCRQARANVFAYAHNALYAHAGFNIDWGGNSPDGMQAGRGHRMAIMSVDGDYTNVGIAMAEDNDSATRVGPLVTTGNYCSAAVGRLDHYNRFLVGTVWNDLNGDGRYDPGEGSGGVTIIVDSNEYYAVTSAAGGYAIPITQSGRHQVSFYWSQLEVRNVTVGDHSVLLDLLVPASLQTGSPAPVHRMGHPAAPPPPPNPTTHRFE
ncbi:MAG: CAP domain-containing protein [Caldilineaceae bacterium]|nr:CAP domain-containing protein [Caldilineaceae bacterium]